MQISMCFSIQYIIKAIRSLLNISQSSCDSDKIISGLNIKFNSNN